MPAEEEGKGLVCLVYGEKLQTRFARKYIHTNDPILSCGPCR